MSESVDRERVEMSIEFRLERSKRIRRQLDDVTRLWLEGLSITLIAQRLGIVDRNRVYWCLRALQLVDSRALRASSRRKGQLYTLRVPDIDEANRVA